MRFVRGLAVVVALCLPFTAQAQDLALGDVSCSNGGLILFNVFNIGNAPVGQHQVQISDGGGRVVSNLATQRPLNPGGANTVSWQLQNIPGFPAWPNQSYLVVVDPNASVGDINRSNNGLAVFCPGGRAAGIAPPSTTLFPGRPAPSAPPGIVITPGGSGPTITITQCSPILAALGICVPPPATIPPTTSVPPLASAPVGFDLSVERAACLGSQLRFQIRNVGSSPSTATNVTLADASGRIVGRWAVRQLAANEVSRVAFLQAVTGQSYQVTVIPAGDTNPANDVAVFTCQPGAGRPPVAGAPPPVTRPPPPSRPPVIGAPPPPPPLVIGPAPQAGAPLYACRQLMGTPHPFPDDLAWNGSNLWGVNLEAANTVTMTDTVTRRYLDLYGSIRTVGGALFNMDSIISTADRPNAGMGLTGLTWDGTYLWLAHYWLITHPDRAAQGQGIFLWQLQPQQGPRGNLFLQEISSIEFQPWQSQQGRPRGLAWDPATRTLWASDDAPGNVRGAGWIYNINPQTGNILARFPAPTALPSGLTWDPGHGLWVATYDRGDPRFWLLSPIRGPNRRDPGSNGAVVTSQTACSAGPTGLAFDGAPWAANESPNFLYRLQ